MLIALSLPYLSTFLLHTTLPPTGNAVSADIAFFEATGADQVLIKPVNADHLEVVFAKHGLAGTGVATESVPWSSARTFDDA